MKTPATLSNRSGMAFRAQATAAGWPNDRQVGLFIGLLFAGLVASMLISLTFGRYPVPLADVIRIVSTTGLNEARPYSDTQWVVVQIVRMPRILLVTLCGMGLGLAGAAMQGLFRNPLVGPEVAGVSAGASFGGVLAIMMSWPAVAITGSAFVFGFGALVLAFMLGKLAGRSSILALILAGVIVGSFFGALTGLAQYVADPETKLPSIVYWLLGSFVGASYDKVAIVAGVTLVAGTLLLLMRWRINLLSLGEVDAQALGIKVELLRWTIVGLVALLIAAQVSVSGGVGFVGLIIPHMARMIVGPDHVRLLPASALLGGIYLLIMDGIARSATSQEIPIGLLTSVMGAPIFAWLFWRLEGQGWGRE